MAQIDEGLSQKLFFSLFCCLKGTPIYLAPEILTDEKYSKSGDVYSFAYLVYEILTGNIPEEKISLPKLIKKITVQGYRPPIESDIPEAYKSLIERCWSQQPEDRPSFDEIVLELKTNPGFITELVDENEFFDYVDYIDNYKTTFDTSKKIVSFEDFIKTKGRVKKIEKVFVNSEEKALHNSTKTKVKKERNSQPKNDEQESDVKIKEEKKDDEELIKVKEEMKLTEEDEDDDDDEEEEIEKVKELLLEVEEEETKLEKVKEEMPKEDDNPEKIIEEDEVNNDEDLMRVKEELPTNSKRKSSMISKRSITQNEFEIIRSQMQEEQKEKIIETLPTKIKEDENYVPVKIIEEAEKKDDEKDPEKSQEKVEKIQKLSPSTNDNQQEADSNQSNLSESLLTSIKNRSKEKVERCQLFIVKKSFIDDKYINFNKFEQLNKDCYTVYQVQDKETKEIYAAKFIYGNYDVLDIEELYQTTTILSYIEHPLINKYYGHCYEERPIIIKEFVPNKSLYDLLKEIKKCACPSGWTDTKKLINIYGIASGMSFLHSCDILHCNLKLENILLDENYLPKITDISFSKPHLFNLLYTAPEAMQNDEYSKASDVYAFAFIVCEILSNEIIENEMYNDELIKKVVKDHYRPEISELIPPAFKELIEICWSQNPNDRHTFDEILNELKNNEKFVTDTIDVDEFYDFVDNIDNTECKGIPKEILEASKQKKKLFSRPQSEYGLYPPEEFVKLHPKCQRVVIEAIDDDYKKYNVGKYLVEGLYGFPKNVELGVKYLKKAKSNEPDALFYLCELLIKGEVVPQDLAMAKKYLKKNMSHPSSMTLYGKICKIEKHYSEAQKYFLKCAKEGSVESMYEYGKMLFLGEGVKKNEKEAYGYFFLSKSKGYKKSEDFLNVYQLMKKIKEFDRLNDDTKYFFITKTIKSNDDYFGAMKNQSRTQFPQINFSSLDTEKLYFNNSFKSIDFIELLAHFNVICIEIDFPSPSFKMIFDLVSKIKKNRFNYMQIHIKINELKETDTLFRNNPYITHISFGPLITSIFKEAFWGCSSLEKVYFSDSLTEICKSAFRMCISLKDLIIPSVIEIGHSAFFGCKSLKKAFIPNVANIGPYAFYKCVSLFSIRIPSSVTKIEPFSFNECISMRFLQIASSVTEIGSCAFFRCNSLTELRIPPSVEKIGQMAFLGIELKKVYVPSSLKSIGNKAFPNNAKIITY